MAHAGVDEQPYGKRKVFVQVEVADGLGPIVDLKGEAVPGQILDEISMLVADDDGDVDQESIGAQRSGSIDRSLVAVRRGGVQNRPLCGTPYRQKKQRPEGGCARHWVDSHH